MTGLPPLPLTAPPANPLPGGLYTAARGVDAPDDRHHGGIALESPNTGGAGQWPTACPTPEETPEKTGGRAEPAVFPATVVWAADECHTVGVTDDEARARAAQTLRLREPVEVEKHVAAQLTAKAEAEEQTAATLAEAVAVAEEKIAAAGYVGVLHASRRLIVAAETAKLIRREGQTLLTPGGHQWAVGAGYTALGADTIVATRPVIIRRGPVESRIAVDARRNTRVAVAERVVAAAWELPTTVITITTTS